MEQMPSDPVIVESKTRSPGWFSVWVKIVTSPKEQVFIDIVEHSDAKQNAAFVWVFIAGILPIVVAGIIQAILAIAGLDELYADDPDVMSRAVSGILVLVTYTCVSPFLGAFVVGIFGLGVGCVQWVARIIGGTGSYEKLVYILGAIAVPFLSISPVVIFLTLVLLFVNAPVVAVMWVVELLLLVYTLALGALAIKAVNRFGWLQAAGLTLLLGLGIVTIFGCCLFFGIFGAA